MTYRPALFRPALFRPTLFRPALYRPVAVALAILALFAGALLAAPYPDHTDLYVNDLAGVLGPKAVARLRADLQGLKAETGVEMTVLTIPSRTDYDLSPSIETFATGLFNRWGIGRTTYNDGILVLVAVGDHEMRIALGSGYDQGYDTLAQDIVNRWFLPAFRNGDYSGGIEDGVKEAIDRIARAHAKGLPAAALPPVAGKLFDRIFPYIFGFLATAMVAMAVFGRAIGDWTYRFRACPVCGQRGLHREHVVQNGTMTNLDPAQAGTTAQAGTNGFIITRCPHCNYSDRQPWRTTGRTGGGGGSFGGGRSSGGGATGRW